MKRVLKSMLVLAMLLAVALPVSAAAPDAVTTPEAPAAITMAPVRAVLEAAGATVRWFPEYQTAEAKLPGLTIDITVGATYASVNGVSVLLPQKAAVVEGSLVAPLNFLQRVLGFPVQWDAAAAKVTVDPAVAKAMYFVRALLAGKTNPQDFTPAFAAAMPAPRLLAVAQSMPLQFGRLKKVGYTGESTKTAVHHSVIIGAMYEKVPLKITVRFSGDDLKVDDYRMDVLQPPMPVAGEPAYADPKAYTEKEVVVGEGSAWPLPATLTMPAGEGPFPAIVLVHGSGPNDRDETVYGVKTFRDLAHGLATKGIAVLRYDKRTLEHGAKIPPTLTVKEETIDDAVEAVKLLSGTVGVDSSRVFVLGHSQGGWLMPRILDQSAAKLVRGAIIMAGPNDFLKAIYDQNVILVNQGQVPPQQIPFITAQLAMLADPSFSPSQPPKGFVLGSPLYYYDWRSKGSELAVKQATPMLVLQGARDLQVPADQLGLWKADLKDRTNVTYKLYDKLNHIFTEGEGAMSTMAEYLNPVNVPGYVIDDIAAWIKAQ